MCGIAGFVGSRNPERADKLLRMIAHRGPDGSGIFEQEEITLVHARLAIQDIAAGAQPMRLGNLSIVFNGEIYNHMRLRSSLTHQFKTRSDTETLLALYEQEGEAMLERLDGMYAFAIYNSADQTLFLARDRYGKKPLYYTFDDGFVFASEIGALRSLKRYEHNEAAIAAFLRFGFIPFAHTVYKGVYKLLAGRYMRLQIKNMNYSLQSWFDSKTIKKTAISKNEALEVVESALKQSIKDRLDSSDVEVGAFLSGGIDSSLICHYAALEKPSLKTFTVRFAGAFDESSLAEATARAIGTRHQTIDIDAHIKDDIETILNSYGEPFADSSAVPSWYVAKAARQFVKVALNGDGADELFGGYRRYIPIANNLDKFAQIVSPLARFLPKPSIKMSGYNYFYRLINSAAERDKLIYWLKTRSDICEGVFPLVENPLFLEARTLIDSFADESPLAAALYADQSLLLFGDLLVKMDIATMQHALEGRSPFLSRDVSKIAQSLPDRFKVRGITTKYLLRRLAKLRIGEAVATAPKRGFEVPLKSWVQNDLREMIGDRLNAPNALWRNYLNAETVDAIWQNKQEIGAEKRAKLLWTIFVLENWYAHDRLS
ncbi:asparagine synthetase B [Campylobacterota bacterium]|nr:asparagine synthetase B [Campylobacterota bacterium]